MFSKRGIEILAGALLLATVVGVVVAIVTYPEPIDTSIDEVRETLVEIADDRDLFVVSISFATFANLIAILLAGALYATFRSHDRTLALLGSFGFLAAGVLELSATRGLAGLLALAQDYVSATGAETDAIVAAARAMGPVATLGFPGATGIAIGMLAYGALVVRTQAVPRLVGWIGIVSGVVIPFGWLAFLEDDLSPILPIGLGLGLIFFLIVGGWLLARGAKEPAGA